MVYAYENRRRNVPAAPFIRVEIINPKTPDSGLNYKSIISEGLIDTGADATLIPIELLARIGASMVGGSKAFRNAGSKEEHRYPFSVNLVIGNRGYPKTTVWHWEKSFVLIGRDILNQEHITLNGPEGTFKIKEFLFLDFRF